ncbi:hypothetical protein WR25_04959 isoform B [Diploscapter pachys]|uniref:Uncharacterized protein n=1 Tax=Diploscapter pachys TaxID=2018661 RepID=A0A2A2JQV1_9BILA|nr:hypothetical protein WR25_04959 isoform B [Diploscapter pachys]
MIMTNHLKIDPSYRMRERNRQEMLRMNEEREREHARAVEAEMNKIAEIKQEAAKDKKRAEEDYEERQRQFKEAEDEMKQLHQQRIDEMNQKYKEAEERRDKHGDAMIANLNAECEQMMKIQEGEKERLKAIMEKSERNHKGKMAILDKQLNNIQQTHNKLMEGYRAEEVYLEAKKTALNELKFNMLTKEVDFISGLRITLDEYTANSQFNYKMNDNKRTADRTLRYITDIKRINDGFGRIKNEAMKKKELDALSFKLDELKTHAEQAQQTASEDMGSIEDNFKGQSIGEAAKEILQGAHDIHQTIVENHVDIQKMDINDDESKQMIKDIINQEDKLRKIFENIPKAVNAIEGATSMINNSIKEQDPSVNKQLEQTTTGEQPPANARQQPGQKALNYSASSRKQIGNTNSQPGSYSKRY